jgi:hypothetical protein
MPEKKQDDLNEFDEEEEEQEDNILEALLEI